ncbi:PREDICTED: uncharacterized protein LOC104586481 [Nelumbo nucifera]|uniref:Uncharacterized protein n=2 Tax=Nelumbo nucifera TaxID=4432 RepID=A0A822Z3A5_NELNU|nr:PREDICTED: uncharacterized protein LOC104586481 [Nelumbo nucifera]DAD38993.1 TPA_asm: hypothetical protein HUJ06_013316 [Nelumbo nucifera]
MDLWSLHVNNSTRGPFCAKTCPFLQRNSWPERPFSCNLGKTGSLRVEDGKVLEIRVSKLKNSSYRSMIVRAMGKKNHDGSSSGSSDKSTPEGDGLKGKDPGSDGNKSNESTSHKSRIISDWRTFRANLVAREQVQNVDSDSSAQDRVYHEPTRSLGLKWAHPIPVPETGCVLVATEKLDGVRAFERTVVLLLRSGTKRPYEGPFGVIINRPLPKRIKHMKPTNLDLATTFADCSLHFGGPLEASMFLLKTGEKFQLPGFEQVIPGLCFGSRNSLDEAAGLVKRGVLRAQDFRFFVGYAGWQLDQLREEIESDYWYVAACSANLICGGSQDSSSGLWEEILQLMGGHYSELSRKPKQDGS